MKATTYNFSDFMDNSDTADEAFQRLVAKLAKTAPDTPIYINFDRRRYDFYEAKSTSRPCFVSNHEQTGTKHIAMCLENRANLVLDGNGAEFIFHGTVIPLALLNTENCQLKNFSIDYQYPQLHQLVIENVNTKRNEFTVKIDPPEDYFIKNNNQLFFQHENNPQHPMRYLMTFNADGRLGWNLPDRCFNPELITPLPEHRLKLSNWFHPGQAGDILVLRPNGRPTPGIFLHHCRDTRLENVTIHYAFGMGLLAQLCENIHLNQFQVRRSHRTSPRYFTTQADATHFSGCKGKIVSENGFYESMADDAINVHGTYLQIQRQIDSHSVVASYMHNESYGFDWGEPGDEVRLIRAKNMEYLPEILPISQIFPIDAATGCGAKQFKILFSTPLPRLPDNEKYGLENFTWMPSVEFRCNVIRHNRARGALFSTVKPIICENNLFDHTHGSAILLCGDCNGWFESSSCGDVVIRGNHFVNALTANYQFTEGVISICPAIPDLTTHTHYFHRNIEINNNEFDIFDAQLLYAKSTENLRFANNVIRKNQDFTPFHPNKFMFKFEHVKNVVISENRFVNIPPEECLTDVADGVDVCIN